jgi:glycosyltransferase involved in cell wall biosynthesis
MACGNPVVATYNGGSEEIITSEDYGFLVEPANPKDLAEKILIALDKEWVREKIRKYAELFRWGNIVRKIIKVYETLLSVKRNLHDPRGHP